MTRKLHFAGYDFESGSDGTKVCRRYVDISKQGDYGADPLPGGLFRMVPSGDIVDLAERNRRLSK